MSQPVLVKVYAAIEGAAPTAPDIEKICRSAHPAENAATSMDGDALLISFEGIWFPVDEVLEALERSQTPAWKGKMDVLDLEDWRLIRYVFKDGSLVRREAPLNNVLDYSGH
ncbi:MAG: hypothetical protein K2H64_12475 [Desulfovibrio sp.]|nr:hypothetical protein [Desulfovibrio sp.]